MALAALPFGLAIGLTLGMLGSGGSVLAVPVLVYVLGQNVHDATTASLVVVTAGALAGGLRQARDSGVCTPPRSVSLRCLASWSAPPRAAPSAAGRFSRHSAS